MYELPLSLSVCGRVGKIACLEHYDELCSTCPASSKCLRYRYTLDEFPSMIEDLQTRVQDYERWLDASQAAVSATGDKRVGE